MWTCSPTSSFKSRAKPKIQSNAKNHVLPQQLTFRGSARTLWWKIALLHTNTHTKANRNEQKKGRNDNRFPPCSNNAVGEILLSLSSPRKTHTKEFGGRHLKSTMARVRTNRQLSALSLLKALSPRRSRSPPLRLLNKGNHPFSVALSLSLWSAPFGRAPPLWRQTWQKKTTIGERD